MKIFAVPLLRMLGSLCENMIRIGLPLTTVKLRSSKARVAARRSDLYKSLQRLHERESKLSKTIIFYFHYTYKSTTENPVDREV